MIPVLVLFAGNALAQTFTGIESSAGIGVTEIIRGFSVADYDGDHLPDLLITCERGVQLFRNEGNGKFSDISGKASISTGGMCTPGGGFWWDYDRDGLIDIYTGIQGGNALYSGNQSGTFEDRAGEFNLSGTGPSSQAGFSDLDNDGDQDLIFSSGTSDLPLRFLNNTAIEREPASGMNRLSVYLRGIVSNRDGLGAEVMVRYGDRKQFRYIHGTGNAGQSLRPVHFGLDSTSAADTLIVAWPSGNRDTITGIPANTVLEITENSGYSVLNLSSEKVYGCLDPHSCSYQPDATINDASMCTYLPGGQLTGTTDALMLGTEIFTYSGVEGDEFEWTV